MLEPVVQDSGPRRQDMKTLSTGIFVFLFALAAHAETGNSNNHRNNAAALGQFSESLRELSSRVSPSVVRIVGTGFGFENDAEHAGVSVVARQLTEDDAQIYVQTDAPINPGNSGGPLVDATGSLVGINTFIFSKSGGSEGIGFAIPSDVVRYAYASLRKDGHVHRGQIGIRARTITEPLASAFDIERDKGVLVEDVAPDSPAEDAGVQVDDVVLSV